MTDNTGEADSPYPPPLRPHRHLRADGPRRDRLVRRLCRHRHPQRAAEENGVSHFLEHMAFKGTERRSAAQIAEEIEAVGGHINAYTAREQTAYYVKVLKEDTALAADIIGDILTHSTFEPEELERERGVILQEIGQANDTPDDIIFDHFQEAAYPAQPMGRPVLGTEEVIRGLSRSALTGYMRRHYPANNVVVAAAAARTRADPRSRAPSFHRSHRRTAAAGLPGPVSGRRVPRGARPRSGAHRARLPVGRLRRSRLLPDSAALHPARGGMSSRLFQEVREKRGLVYSVYSFSAPYMDGGLFGIYAGTGESEAAELMPVTLEELRKVQAGVTEPELARARAQVKASLLMSLESTGSRCEQLARQIQVFGRVIPTGETVSKLNAVTIEDVRRAAMRVFRGTPTLAALGPASRVPGLSDIADVLAA